MSPEYRTVTYNASLKLEDQTQCINLGTNTNHIYKNAGFYQVQIEKSIDMHVSYENLQQMQELSFLKKNDKAST